MSFSDDDIAKLNKNISDQCDSYTCADLSAVLARLKTAERLLKYMDPEEMLDQDHLHLYRKWRKAAGKT